MLQGFLLMLMMDENTSQQSNKKNADDGKLTIALYITTKQDRIAPTWGIEAEALNR